MSEALTRKQQRQRAYYLANKDRLLKYAAEYRDANREEINAEHKERYRANKKARVKAAVDNRNRKREEKAGKPPDRCEVCGAKFDFGPGGNKGKCRPHLDHNHETDEFRGWLCRACNTALGLAGDNPAVLRRLADYLKVRGAYVTRPVIV